MDYCYSDLTKGADNTEEFDVVFITEEEEWSESDVYSTEDNDFALEYFQKKWEMRMYSNNSIQSKK